MSDGSKGVPRALSVSKMSCGLSSRSKSITANCRQSRTACSSAVTAASGLSACGSCSSQPRTCVLKKLCAMTILFEPKGALSRSLCMAWRKASWSCVVGHSLNAWLGSEPTNASGFRTKAVESRRRIVKTGFHAELLDGVQQ